MPTKDELIAFASEAGVDVSASSTKAEIEAALYDAGYDPVTLEAAPMSEPEPTPAHEVQGTDPGLSRQAQFSTYTEAPSDREGENPPPGRTVHQELGTPTETTE